jgi:hypothetical protein
MNNNKEIKDNNKEISDEIYKSQSSNKKKGNNKGNNNNKNESKIESKNETKVVNKVEIKNEIFVNDPFPLVLCLALAWFFYVFIWHFTLSNLPLNSPMPFLVRLASIYLFQYISIYLTVFLSLSIYRSMLGFGCNLISFYVYSLGLV